MSEPKLISPLLDNFIMGDPINEHDGVRCCPAMERETDNKYIVKIISVPASQMQLEALLLSGAYSDSESALAYFRSLSENIVEEVNVLKKLSELEGFTPVEACQIQPMEDETGFDVYLLSAYRDTLQRQLRRGSMTHLSALNLGLDLCAALASARRMGYLYVDLKPGNVYVDENQGYRIGDIGFMKLDSLKYASLPDRYHSGYTAPEITDAYSDLNTTLDVYAVGLILYQIFNDGILPTRDEAGEIPAPAYADYEMAEIILKACAQDPAMRWQDPVELGQALVSYMQRNGAHDTPIVPVPVQEPEELIEEPAQDATAVSETEPEYATEETVDQMQLYLDDPENVTEESIYSEDDEGNLTFIEGIADETAEAEDASEIEYDEVTEEVSDMLQQADELIAHDAPEPVVQPEPIDVPIPPPITLEEETDDIAEDCTESEESSVEEAEPEEQEPDEATEDIQQEEPVEDIDDDEPVEDVPVKKRKGGWIVKTILIILAAALLFAGLYVYKHFYIQTIDAITLEAGEIGELTVKVQTQADESLLSVICTDTYGIQHTSSVVNGKASFTELAPNSAYTIKITASGFHHVIGKTTAAYTTPSRTEIIQFTAVTGSEDGSVILSFTIDGPDSDQWNVAYTADNGQVENTVFSGHMVTLTGLTLGKEYTFTLSPKDKLQLTGTDVVTHTASAIVKPKNLVVTGCMNGKLSAQWTLGDGNVVSSWTVRCYNDSFDETVVVAESAVSFDIPVDKASYTVEVTASGMSVSERVFVSENSVNVKDFSIDNTDPQMLALSWTPCGEVSEGGWVLHYSMDGSAPKQISCESENSATVSPVIPGCNYRFELKTADGETVLGGTLFYATPAGNNFSGYGVAASDMEFKMCKTPSNSNWDRYDLSKSDYTTEFSTEEKASFLVRLKRSYSTSSNVIETLFVIRDESGAVVSTDTSSSTWTKMWYRNYCELDIPGIPQNPGKYTISVYFNGAFVNETAFSVTE